MKRIIIIDDDDSARAVLRGMLEDGGYEVAAEGRDGSEAVPLCRKHSPDVVIMDVRMPGTDGITAAGEISRTSPAAVVIITAGADPGTIAKATEAGVMGYLVKPVRAEELAPAVELASKRFSELRILADENLELRGAVRARKVIEQAKGLLMEKEGLTESEAFGKLRKTSMDKRKTMQEVAEVIISALG